MTRNPQPRTRRRVREQNGGRPHRVTVRYTAAEWAVVTAAAAGEHRALAGYVGEAALAAARGEPDTGPGSVRERIRLTGVELMAARIALNLTADDVGTLTTTLTAAAAGGTGEPDAEPGVGPDAAAVIAACRQTVRRLDAAMTELLEHVRRAPATESGAR